MVDPGVFGDRVGTSEADLDFQFNWGNRDLFSGSQDHIGFQAQTGIFVYGSLSEVLTFKISSNNGHRLYIDGAVAIDAWADLVEKTTGVTFVTGPYRGTKGMTGERESETSVVLSPGGHKLVVEYYEWEGEAHVSLSVTR